MRAVIQRVKSAQVSVDDEVISAIDQGLLVYLGIGNDDTINDINYLAEKIPLLRIFEDPNEKMNLSVKDVAGEILLVSQFTLFGDCRKGRRPGFDAAMPPQQAKQLFNTFLDCLQQQKVLVKTGVFQAHMLIESINDGPVTILLDSKKIF